MSLLENESLIVSIEFRVSETDDSPGAISGLILPIGRIARRTGKRFLLLARPRFLVAV